MNAYFLVDDEGRIRVANAAARMLLAGGEPLVGHLLEPTFERREPALRDVLRGPDGLHVVMLGDTPETLHLTRHPVRVREVRIACGRCAASASTSHERKPTRGSAQCV